MLGEVEIKQPVQGIPVATTVLSRSPLSWSEDNNVALATQAGAYIFDLQMSPHNAQAGLLFGRIQLPLPDSPNPFILKGTELQKMVLSLDNTDAQRIMLDASLTAPHRASFEAPHRQNNPLAISAMPIPDSTQTGISKAVWSYSKATVSDGCLLCLVTYDHQVNLRAQVGVRWNDVASLTSIWADYSTGEGRNKLKEYHLKGGMAKHQQFISKTKLLAVTEITWTKQMEDASGKPFSVLLMVTESSHLVVFKIPIFNIEAEFSPSVLDCFALDDSIGKITSVHWLPYLRHRGYLSVGTVQGDVQLYNLSLQENNLSLNHLFTFDNILKGMYINHLELVYVDAKKKNCILFVGKHNFLLAYLVSIDSSKVQILAFTHSVLGCYCISGLKILSPSLVYASVKDGKVVKLNVDFDIDSKTIAFRDQEVTFKSDGVHYNGLCFSPNHIFLAILECVSVPYDHLIMREPAVISLFQVNTFNTIMNNIETNETMALYEQIDMFESLRLMPYSENDISFPTVAVEGISRLSSYFKRVQLFITIIGLSSLSRDDCSKDKVSLERLKSGLKKNIVIDYVYDLFTSLSRDSFPENSMHRLSLFLMCSLLQSVKRSHPLIKNLKSHFKSENFKGKESCIVCKTEVEFSSIEVAKCSQGHSLPRCLRTLVPTLPILQCTHCHLFYHPQACTWYGEEASRCLICLKKLIMRVGGRRKVLEG